MELAELIKERRAELGMTQIRLAEILGRSASTIRSWERGAALPSEDVHDALAAALNIDPALLSGDAESPDGAVSPPTGPLDDFFEDAPAEPRVDNTTVMGGGIAMSMPVEPPVVPEAEEAEAEPEVLVVDEAHSIETGAAAEAIEEEPLAVLDAFSSDDDEDTDESDVIEVVPASGRYEPRLLGMALSTDPIPELEETRVATGGATAVITSPAGSTAAVAAPPYPTTQAPDVLPEQGRFTTNWRELTTYQIRRILTIASLIGLVLVLRWAMGGFIEGFNTLKDSLLSNVNL